MIPFLSSASDWFPFLPSALFLVGTATAATIAGRDFSFIVIVIIPIYYLHRDQYHDDGHTYTRGQDKGAGAHTHAQTHKLAELVCNLGVVIPGGGGFCYADCYCLQMRLQLALLMLSGNRASPEADH